CQPRLIFRPEIEVIRSEAYCLRAQRLAEVQVSQERTISDIVRLIRSKPDTVRVIPQMTGSKPAYRLDSDQYDLVRMFGIFSGEPEIVAAIKATEEQRQAAAAKDQALRAARPFADTIKPKQEDQNRSLIDRSLA